MEIYSLFCRIFFVRFVCEIVVSLEFGLVIYSNVVRGMLFFCVFVFSCVSFYFRGG